MKVLKVIGLSLLGVFILLAVIGAMMDGDTTEPANNEQAKTEETNIATKVEAALDNLGDDMKSSIAATSVGGTQGDIEKVEADGKNGVKVHVSTHYSEAGDEGGRNIANKIMGNICHDVPELQSVYVTSTSSGLDSQSVYRSDLPGCKL